MTVPELGWVHEALVSNSVPTSPPRHLGAPPLRVVSVISAATMPHGGRNWSARAPWTRGRRGLRESRSQGQRSASGAVHVEGWWPTPTARFYTSSPTLVISCLLFFSFESGCEMVSVVLIYRSLMTDDVEHLFKCLLALAIRVSSLERSTHVF